MPDTPDEKLEKMMASWIAPAGIRFKNPEAGEAYRLRVKRLQDAVLLKKPDRVPVYANTGFLPSYLAGVTPEDVMYDYSKLADAWKKHVFEFQPDTYGGSAIPGPGKCYEILDYKLYNWPGHGASPDSPYQCVEAEYMTADEYDDLIDDPSDFLTRKYIPRIFGKLAAFTILTPPDRTIEMPFTPGYLTPFGSPDVQAALKALMAAGEEAVRWGDAVSATDNEINASGFPGFSGGFSKAPYDTLSDTLRGTRGIMLDIYRRPEKVLEALDRLVPLAIKMGAGAAKAAGRPLVTLPLHKGADGFMTDEHFRTIYWPSLKKVLLGLIEEGLVPYLFAEGGYNSRLEIIKDLPAARTIWHFDQTDMAEAKRVLGKTACIVGNVPVSLLNAAAADDVREYCRKLIEVAGKDGGFILASGGVIDKARPENVKAMINSVKEYGVYA